MIGSMPASTTGTSTILHQMGFPSKETINKLIQYSFVGLALSALGLILFGMVAKKKVPKQFITKVIMKESKTATEEPKVTHQKPVDVKLQPNLRSIRILQERLAKGEITSSEFENLKRLLE